MLVSCHVGWIMGKGNLPRLLQLVISQNAFLCHPSVKLLLLGVQILFSPSRLHCLTVEYWNTENIWTPHVDSCTQLSGNRKCVLYPPGSLVLLGVDHGVLDGFVDQSVHVEREGFNGLHQSLTALRQKLLSIRIHTKLHLTEREWLIRSPSTPTDGTHLHLSYTGFHWLIHHGYLISEADYVLVILNSRLHMDCWSQHVSLNSDSIRNYLTGG